MSRWTASGLFTSLTMPNNFGQVRSGPLGRPIWRRPLILLSELEDILKIPGNASLSLLDATLKRSIAFSASYHGTSPKMLSLTILSLMHAENYLQSPLQLEHACNLIFDSELFTFHSERMCEILTDEAAVVSSGCAKFIVPKQTNAMSSRTQIHILSLSYLAFCSTMDDATQVFYGLANAGNLCFRSSWIMLSLTSIPISRTLFPVQHPPQVRAQVGRD